MSNFTIAKYIRLSIEDEKTESLSIENQRLLLDRYIDEMDISNAQVREFCDNGYSGVNMERPAVQELLDLVRSGGVNILIIKDFSRFSRNAMDSGYFVDQVFPLYGVRLISVSDGFDSEDYKGNTGGIDISFKFLMHEYYSQDLSMKIKSAKRLKMKNGEMIMAGAIYGYRKINGKWEPDGVASEIVRRIYAYALDGYSSSQIRDKLCWEQIPTPQEYIELGWGKEIIPTFLWNTEAVTRILTNEQYKGTYISGKHEKSLTASKRVYSVPKSDWIVLPNWHTPIIEPEIFDKVQAILKRSVTRGKSLETLNCTVVEHKNHKWLSQLPYGYRKASSNICEIDNVSSAVVRKIFDLALQGKCEAEIADLLTSERFLTPGDYKKTNSGKPIEILHDWQADNVRKILRKVQYTGVYVSGKYYIGEDGKRHFSHERDWKITPGAIPAIISKETYEKAADIMANRDTRTRTPGNHLLRGVVKCGCCGHAMKHTRQFEPVYRCYHAIADTNAACHKFEISANLLDKIILTTIRKKAQIVLDCADLSKLRHKTADEQKIANCELAILQNAEERQTHYERFVLGEILRDEYLKLKDEWSARLNRLELQLSAMKSELDAGKIAPRSIAAAKSALSETANNRELVETLIESVRVYPDKRVDINWKISDFGIQG